MGRKRMDSIPPYISYRTFRNFLEELKARGVPSRIDRSVMSHKSGTVQSQLLLSLDYLGLLKSSGHPTEKMKKLLESEGTDRKAVLREIIETAYGFVFAHGFGLKTATSHQAEELFQKTGASGETVRRCLSFFLAAAKDSGIPVSPYIKPHQRKRRTTLGKRQRASRDAATSSHPDSDVEGETRKVHLKSGGSLSLKLSVCVFDLDAGDRDFIFGLIDQLKDYEGETEEAD
jgi:hypothetical protein